MKIPELKNTIRAIKKSTDGFNRIEIAIKIISTKQKAKSEENGETKKHERLMAK